MGRGPAEPERAEPPAHASSPAAEPERVAAGSGIPLDVAAAVAVALLVVVASAVGLAAGGLARPLASPPPRATVAATATPEPTPEDPAAVERRALAQPLVAGCATDEAVWVFSDGGAAIRFDGTEWTIPDRTLRSHLAAACRPNEVFAVGRNGSMLRADDVRRQVRIDRYGIDDLAAVAVLPDAALIVGDRGTVLLQTSAGVRELGSPFVVSDLRAVAASFQRFVDPRRAQAWAVGAGGAAYRLLATGWEPVPTGTTSTLRGVVMDGEAALAVGDRGTVVRYADGAWGPLRSDVETHLRAIAIVGAGTAWIVGDHGVVVEVKGDTVRRVDLGTTCTLRSVFTQDAAIWIVGSDGERGAVWRVAPSGTTAWGSCS